MDTYAVIVQGLVVNLVLWDGVPFNPGQPEVPADDSGSPGLPAVPPSGWSPPEGSEAVLVPAGIAVDIGFSYADGIFTAPPAPAQPPVTAAERVAERDARLRIAATLMAPLQDAHDIGVATEEEEALLLKWKQYRVALSRVDQQAGYPADMVWPEVPQ